MSTGAKKEHAEAKRKARKARRRKQTRDEILDATLDVALRNGVSGVTVSAVAEELGLTIPALYYYFASKEALLFELVLRDWLQCGADVEEAVAATESGADAVEAMIRTVFGRYLERLEVFTLVHHKMSEFVAHLEDRGELSRIRPVNDMLYKGTEDRLRADQKRGVFPKERDPRRFAFTAHMAALGLLTMRAMTASANDPLIHRDEDLVADLCRTYRLAAEEKKRC